MVVTHRVSSPLVKLPRLVMDKSSGSLVKTIL